VQAALRRLRREQHGFTLVELLMTMIILGFVMAGLSNILTSGSRAESDATARMTGQQNVRDSTDRLDFEARCASTASLISSGAGVALTMPATCSHATGTVSWCVVSGALVRFTSAGCPTSGGQVFIRSVTTPTPFSIVNGTAGSGQLPQLAIRLTVNTTGRASDAFTLTDSIALRNGTRA
jgi:prepilin-type N-terminal cleavage/methylation domain-containing protein